MTPPTSMALSDQSFRISLDGSAGLGRNGLLLGLLRAENGLEGIICLEDGRLATLGIGFFTIDYRYDPETDQWTDVSDQQG